MVIFKNLCTLICVVFAFFYIVRFMLSFEQRELLSELKANQNIEAGLFNFYEGAPLTFHLWTKNDGYILSGISLEDFQGTYHGYIRQIGPYKISCKKYSGTEKILNSITLKRLGVILGKQGSFTVHDLLNQYDNIIKTISEWPTSQEAAILYDMDMDIERVLFPKLDSYSFKCWQNAASPVSLPPHPFESYSKRGTFFYKRDH